jgi:hypothetical protein
MLPVEIRGFKAEEPDGLYDAETLHQYINGSAEVYRALNVRVVCGRRYVNAGGSEIIADVFEMKSASDAFGAYHHDLREGEPAEIGQESEYAEGTLAFWKGRYFSSIVALDESPEADSAVLELGRAIANSIDDEGAPPDLLRFLPERGLLPMQIRYFHEHSSFSRYYFLAEENVLNLGKQTEAILASYGDARSLRAGGSRPVYLLVSYPSAALAKEGFDGLLKAYRLEGDVQGIGRSRGGKWVAVRAVDRLLVGIFDAPTRAEVGRSLQDVLDRIGGGTGKSRPERGHHE